MCSSFCSEGLSYLYVSFSDLIIEPRGLMLDLFQDLAGRGSRGISEGRMAMLVSEMVKPGEEGSGHR